jgi:hypothetical protein
VSRSVGRGLGMMRGEVRWVGCFKDEGYGLAVQ